ncbi:hypothetical protein AMTRI_Chr03g145110 [Amborella trichopoda]
MYIGHCSTTKSTQQWCLFHHVILENIKNKSLFTHHEFSLPEVAPYFLTLCIGTCITTSSKRKPPLLYHSFIVSLLIIRFVTSPFLRTFTFQESVCAKFRVKTPWICFFSRIYC